MTRYGIIYIATNKINGKSYIGQTVDSLNKRILKHYVDSKKHTYKFANALKKYNKSDWEWRIVYKNISHEQLDVAEICAIYNYNTYYNGYNSTEGGEDNPMRYPEFREKLSQAKKGKKREPFSDQWKKNMSLSGKGKKFTEEHREKMSRAKAGENNPMYGMASKGYSLYGKDNPMYGKLRPDLSERNKLNIGKERTKESKQKQSNSLSKNEYLIIKPDGATIIIKNLNQFCKDNNLNSSCMYKTAKGILDNHKKYVCKKVK